MIVTRSDIESFKRFVPKLALAGAAVLILSAFAPSSDAAVFTAREGDAPLEFTLPAHETTMVAIPADPKDFRKGLSHRSRQEHERTRLFNRPRASRHLGRREGSG